MITDEEFEALLPSGYDPATDPAFDEFGIGSRETPPAEIVGTEQTCYRCKQAFTVGPGPLLTILVSRTFLHREIAPETTAYGCDNCAAELIDKRRPRKKALPSGSERTGRRKHVEWIKSDWFCPKCGKKDVWQEVDCGNDEYHECSVTCGSCGHVMCCVEKVLDTEARS